MVGKDKEVDQACMDLADREIRQYLHSQDRVVGDTAQISLSGPRVFGKEV